MPQGEEVGTTQLIEPGCPFCNLAPERIRIARPLCLVFRDAFPVSPGHTLVIPRRHVGSFFLLEPDERVALLDLVEDAKIDLDAELHPDGYNIGVNDGSAAGQTVAHVHIHLIPRYLGDTADPRGGVRWIFPDRADYWTKR